MTTARGREAGRDMNFHAPVGPSASGRPLHRCQHTARIEASQGTRSPMTSPKRYAPSRDIDEGPE